MLSLIATLHTAGFHLKNRFEDEKGATAVEYGLIIALIAIAVVGGATLLGGEISALLTRIANDLKLLAP